MTLETGWLPNTPINDSIERQALAVMADRVAETARLAGVPLLDDDRVAVAAMDQRSPFANLGVVKQPIVDPDRLVDDIGDALDGAPCTFLSPWAPPPDAPIGVDGYPPFMVLWPEAAKAPPGVADLEVREVTDAADLARVEQTLVKAYPLEGVEDWSPGRLFPPGLLGGASHFFLGSVDGEDVAVSVARVGHGLVEVEFVATMESHRGRGIGAVLTARAAAVAPDVPAVLQSSDPGRGVYESLGYRTLRRWAFCIVGV